MSGATDSGMIKTMGMVASSLAVLGVIIMIAARTLGGGGSEDTDDPVLRNALINRIEPVAAVRTSADDLPAGGAAVVASAPKSADELINGVCSACHTNDAVGAPVIGDEAEWAVRRELGLDGLVAAAINGIGAMPPRGGSSYSDEEMRLAVQKMAGFEIETSAEVATAEDVVAAKAPVADAEEAPVVEEVPAADAEQAPAEEAPAPTETGSSSALFVGQVPEGLTDNIKASVDNLCSTCHLAGIGGAPKTGDRAAWQKRADKGLDVLMASVINGLGVMPPRGATSLTDDEMPIAIQYLMSK